MTSISDTPPLLRLPAELRTAVFEHVLCHKTIHAGLRRLQPDETGGLEYSAIPFGFVERYKPMYAVCTAADADWSRAYASSQHPPDLLKHSYTAAHVHCHGVLNDIFWQDFMALPALTCPCVIRPCLHFFQHRRQLVERWGEPPKGVLNMHAETKLDLRLLLVCRQIYKDAALLPYTGNTFSFQVPMDMNIFLDEFLKSHQREAIQRIFVYIGALTRPTLPAKVPAGLQSLFCYVRVVDVDLEETKIDGIEHLEPWTARFDTVQVIVGDGGRKPTTRETLLLRRTRATRLERLLSRRGSTVGEG